MCCVLLVLVVISANRFAGLQVGIALQQSEIRELRELQHRTGAVLAERENPSNIEAYARERGMVLASDASYVAVSGADVAGLPSQDR
jgi:hypothetical protein